MTTVKTGYGGSGTAGWKSPQCHPHDWAAVNGARDPLSRAASASQDRLLVSSFHSSPGAVESDETAKRARWHVCCTAAASAIVHNAKR